MIVVLSGEGPSDLGDCTNGQGICGIPDLQIGPMARFVDKEIETHIGYSLLDDTPDSYIFIKKQDLIRGAREASENRKSMSLPGRNRPGVETAYFYKNSRMLAERAKLLAEERHDCAIAVLFRDSDGTNSSPASLWQDKVNSIRQGFADAGFGQRGVAMVPKPKSEAWMLCVVRDNYQQCSRLEELPGNDNAPNSAKVQLSQALDGDSSTLAQLRFLEDAGIDTDLLAHQMPSYGEFHRDIGLACQEIIAMTR